MIRIFLLLLAAFSTCLSEPLTECQPDVMFIADLEDLCSYHWCVGPDNTAIKWRCPPGSRVPTWFETAPSDQEIPCTIDHSKDVSCLRCNYRPDPLKTPIIDSCQSNPCPSQCQCQNLYDTEYHCICPGDEVPVFATDDRRPVDYCEPDRCVNGGVCFSQWDTYWCQCPNGYTGKNCEVPFCEPNPCMNGGTCTIDDHNYRCDCLPCFTGSCCNATLAGSTCSVQCDACEFGDSCQFRRNNLCSCNPCRGEGQLCIDGDGDEDPVCVDVVDNKCEVEPERLCECNPCESEEQVCIDGEVGQVRQCLGKPGPYGTTYTLTFSDDAGTGSTYRRVYISSTGARLNSNSFNRVRIYTPGISSGPCAVDLQVTVSFNDPFFFDVPDNCLNTDGEASNQILRVVELDGVQIAVTVTNMNGDGYLAIADEYAGQFFVAHRAIRSGSLQYITVVALEDNTEVQIQLPALESFSTIVDAPSNILTFNLNSLQSIRYQSPTDVRGSGAIFITSNRNINVWSGNNDPNSQKTQEMLLTVNRWGVGAATYNYVVPAVSTSSFRVADLVYVEAAIAAEVTVTVIRPSGVQTDVQTLTIAERGVEIFSLRPSEILRVASSVPLQVTHSIRGANQNDVNFHSSYALIPSVEQYANSYSFQVHGARNGVGADYSQNIVTIVSMRGSIADAPSSIEDIIIYRYNPQTGLNNTYTVADLGGEFVTVYDFYKAARIELPGPGMYYFGNPRIQSWSFGAVYYGVTVTGRSIQPNTAFPLGYELTRLNDISKPVACNRCRAGPDCSQTIINTCVCNECDNFDDICEDNPDPNQPRICTSEADTTGNPFHLMFMQNRPDNTNKRELEIYVTSAGRSARDVRVYTPFTDPTDECYYDESRSISGLSVSLFLLPNPGCFETIGSNVFDKKIIRVESMEEQDLLVYAVNRDQFSADGWVALPDAGAGREFYIVTHSPPRYFTEFAVLATEDVTITVTYPEDIIPSLPGTTFSLTAGQVLQIQSEQDLTGTRVQSDKPVNVYAGNVRALVVEVEDPQVGDINSGSRDHLVEQMLPVNRWGTQFNVQPIPGRRFGDQLKVVASADGTEVVLARRDPQGAVTEDRFALNSGEFFTRDVISDSTYRVTSNRKIFVTQIVKSAERGSFHDPSLITVPPVEQYSNRYIFSTPEFSGGEGSKRPYNTTLVLISARDQDRDNLIIVNSDTENRVSDLATPENPWRQVPGTDYYNIAVSVSFGTNLILHRDPSVSFMCIFYGFDDRESLGFPVAMKLQILNIDEN